MNYPLSTIIIDDELNNIHLLKRILSKHCPQVNVIGSESKAEQGLKLIASLKPDLVFLDIQMPMLNGFELLKYLEPIQFEVIFVTAHSEHAIEAFEYHAIGYITKPIIEDKLLAAVRNAEERIHQKKTASNIFTLFESQLQHLEETKIPLSTLGGLIFVNLNDIVYCESQGNYTNFNLVEGKRVLVSRQIGDYEKLLPEHHFVRIHDKYIINLKYVNEYIKGRGGEVKLNHIIKLPVSATRKDILLSRFEKWLKH